MANLMSRISEHCRHFAHLAWPNSAVLRAVRLLLILAVLSGTLFERIGTMKGSAYLWGIACLGIALGSGIRLLSHTDPHREGPDGPTTTLPEMNALPSVRPPLSSPSMDDILAADGLAQEVLIRRFLLVASVDDALTLLERAARFDYTQRKRIVSRAIDLDPQRVFETLTRASTREWRLDALLNWARKDPKAALAAAVDHTMNVEAVLLTIAKTHPDKARALAASLDESILTPKLREHLEDQLETQWALEHREEALQHLATLTNPLERKSLLSTILQSWAKEDPLAALAWADAQEGMDLDRLHVLGFIIPELAKSDPSKALDTLTSVPKGFKRGLLESQVLASMATNQPEAALALAAKQPKGAYRDYLLNEIAPKLDLESSEFLDLLDDWGVNWRRPTAFALRKISLRSRGWGSTESSSENQLATRVHNAFLELAQEDPRQALRRAVAMTSHNHEITHSIFKTWVTQDPREAAEWVTAMPNSTTAQSFKESVFGQWSQTDPARAAAFLHESAGWQSEGSAELYRSIAASWARQDPEGLLAWSTSLPAEHRDQVLGISLTATASQDPIIALEHVTSVEDPAQRSVLEASIGKQWGERDPAAALPWMDVHANASTALHAVIKDTAKAWVLSDPQQASQWISQLPSGRSRDHAVAGMVHALVSGLNPINEFEAATQWARTIDDPAMREEWMALIAQRQQTADE